MSKHAQDLATEYEVGNTAEDFYEYIVLSLVNGNRAQVKQFFLQMNSYYREEFLNTWLQDDNGYHTSTRKICVSALIE